MRRYLVVANQTLAGAQLLSTMHELADRNPSTFHVVVPATPPKDHSWTEGEARRTARSRLDAALTRLASEGIDATGEVGDERPFEAVNDVLLRDEEPFDAIIVSTLPPKLSRWLKRDLVRRLEATSGVRVIHVVGQPAPAPTG
jgi:hypothetical protein